jgi:uncharacterized protein (TIGR00304 family)
LHMDSSILISLGILVVFLGFVIILAGILFAGLGSSSSSRASVHGGGVFFIGPIPVVFGTDRNTAFTAAAVGLALMIAYYFLIRGRI